MNQKLWLAMMIAALTIVCGCTIVPENIDGASTSSSSSSSSSSISGYSVTYNGNGFTSGNVPVDTNHYENGMTVAVLANVSNMINHGYMFAGWNTENGGNGTVRHPGSTFTMGSMNVTLYAQWEPSLFTYNISNGFVTILKPSVFWSNTNTSAKASVDLPSQIDSFPVIAIGKDSFYGTIVSNVSFPSTLLDIGDYAFSYSSLTNLTLPTSLTNIGYSTFRACFYLKSLTIPENVQAIGASSFYDCNKLTNVIILASLKTIPPHAFYGCTQLKSITLPQSLVSVETGVFGVTGLINIKLPAGLTNIGMSAFSSCDSLLSITIPSSIQNIESYAFDYCLVLTNIIISNSTPPTLGSLVFNACPSTLKIRVPSASVTAYKTTGNWTNYASYIEAY